MLQIIIRGGFLFILLLCSSPSQPPIPILLANFLDIIIISSSKHINKARAIDRTKKNLFSFNSFVSLEHDMKNRENVIVWPKEKMFPCIIK